MEDKPGSNEKYSNGCIHSVTLRNFGCFQEEVFFFGPHLNLIQGPSMSGKTTILEGINLAFGASPSCFGRGKQFAEFIRDGCSRARVSVVMSAGAGKQTEISILIREPNVRYFIDRKETEIVEIKAFRDHYFIRVDCPFFFSNETSIQRLSDQSPTELFCSVMQAICAEQYPGEYPLFWSIIVQTLVQQANGDFNQSLSLLGGEGQLRCVLEDMRGFYVLGINLRASLSSETPAQLLKDMSYENKCVMIKLLILAFQQYDIFPFWCLDDCFDESTPIFNAIMEKFRSSGSQMFVVTSREPRFMDRTGVRYVRTEEVLEQCE